MQRNTTTQVLRPVARQTVAAAQIPESRLKIQTVIELTGLSASTIRRKTAEGKFPAPIKDGARCTRWVAGQVTAWLRNSGGRDAV
jgi:prophage regulatory protein